MGNTIQAIYENGSFRPLVAIDLPENSLVNLDLHISENGGGLRRKVQNMFRVA